MAFLEENSSKNYSCEFDYNKPLRELKLLNETRGIIATICLNYWCETEEQKRRCLEKLDSNERKYQEELSQRYNWDNIFKDTYSVQEIQKADFERNVAMVTYKENIVKKIINKIKTILGIR